MNPPSTLDRYCCWVFPIVAVSLMSVWPKAKELQQQARQRQDDLRALQARFNQQRTALLGSERSIQEHIASVSGVIRVADPATLPSVLQAVQDAVHDLNNRIKHERTTRLAAEVPANRAMVRRTRYPCGTFRRHIHGPYPTCKRAGYRTMRSCSIFVNRYRKRFTTRSSAWTPPRPLRTGTLTSPVEQGGGAHPLFVQSAGRLSRSVPSVRSNASSCARAGLPETGGLLPASRPGGAPRTRPATRAGHVDA